MNVQCVGVTPLILLRILTLDFRLRLSYNVACDSGKQRL